ncbi:MAG: hypothetical protein KDA71_07910, partial [Planctomycetales bacterium]|nr:hypothetical protein [Planctomycetales bacterium]
LLAVTFQFNFANDGSFGFNDPMKGAERKAALQSTAAEFGSWFNHTATISVDVFNHNTGDIGAFAVAYFDESNPPNDGFYAGIPQQKTLGGADGNGATADGAITVIWENAGPLSVVWELGDDVNNGEIDFQSLVIHELTHLMGFASDVQENGADLWDSGLGNPSVWQPFDQFLSDNAGSRFINPANQHRINVPAWQSAATGGTADNTGVFFNGTNAVAANGGNPVPIYSPGTWEEGSSGSHIRIIDPTYTDATHLMVPFIRDGQVARRWNPVEAAMMRDIGYDIVMPEPAILLTPSGGSTTVTEAGGTDTFDVQLTVRPPSDVKVTIAAADSSEVSVNNPTTLTFTPVNWNSPQTVTLTGVDDSDTDGDVVSLVTASIVVAQSDPMYGSAAAAELTVSTTDNDMPLNVVTTVFDENDANPADGTGVSLREAIQWANSHPGGDQITIDGNVSAMFLTLGQIEITETLSIVGNGAANTIIDANNTSRIFKVTGGDLSLKDLKMQNGVTTVGEIGEGGGAIQFLSSGSLLLDTVQFVNNLTAASSSAGGAVYVGSGGSLMAVNSVFQSNVTLGDNASGGAVFVEGGTFTIQNTIFLGNRTEGIDAGGGAVAADFSSGQIAGTLLQDNFTKGEV